jgi:uncharacterized protein YjbI with pentapeptide repeats
LGFGILWSSLRGATDEDPLHVCTLQCLRNSQIFFVLGIHTKQWGATVNPVYLTGVVLLLIHLCAFTPSSLAQSERGQKGAIDKKTMFSILEKGKDDPEKGWIDGYIIDAKYITAIIKDTKHPIKIKNCIIKGYIDFTNLKHEQIESISKPTEWSEDKYERYIARLKYYSQNVIPVYNELRIIDSDIQGVITRIYNSNMTATALFYEECNFSGSRFVEGADFTIVTFAGFVTFNQVAFGGDAGFNGAMFNGESTTFTGSTFDAYANFALAVFEGNSDFSGATFKGDAAFHGVTFEDNADFSNITFNRKAGFSRTKFRGDESEFTITKFLENASFNDAAFSGDATFRGAKFTADAEYSGSTFKQNADFYEAVFHGTAHFRKSTFLDKLCLDLVKFKGYIDFRDSNIKLVSFYNKDNPVTVENKIDLRNSNITEVHFEDIIFKNDVDFSDSILKTVIFRFIDFESNATFVRCIFNDFVEFNRTTFQKMRILLNPNLIKMLSTNRYAFHILHLIL